ncbi:dihydrofolate reductase [Aquisediminimonas sediminicola]|uniref:dihydrofolate reductase n=1 Tax=Alteraquisediminimonas sediminicola TaxID=2676787 RepID=UPI001C8E8927|nr:dihydrofolate reductase [Aquisediminimonas sediminicola]
MPPIIFILARAVNGVIGLDGQLPWHLPADLKRFKALTMGQPMVMGRKTFESFPKPLPGRRHIVLTRDHDWQREGAEVVHHANEALALASQGDPAAIWIIGGSEIFNLFMARADGIELTEVDLEVQGDAFMPPFDEQDWKETAREDHDGYRFVTLARRV